MFGKADRDWSAHVGTDLFSRDPDMGFVEIGYDFEFLHASDNPRREQDIHVGRLAMGRFLEPESVPPIDFDVTFEYTRTETDCALVHRSDRT